MRLRVTAEVKGDIFLKEKISTQFYIYTFNVFKENESFFISVEKSVSNYLDDPSWRMFGGTLWRSGCGGFAIRTTTISE